MASTAWTTTPTWTVRPPPQKRLHARMGPPRAACKGYHGLPVSSNLRQAIQPVVHGIPPAAQVSAQALLKDRTRGRLLKGYPRRQLRVRVCVVRARGAAPAESGGPGVADEGTGPDPRPAIDTLLDIAGAVHDHVEAHAMPSWWLQHGHGVGRNLHEELRCSTSIPTTAQRQAACRHDAWRWSRFSTRQQGLQQPGRRLTSGHRRSGQLLGPSGEHTIVGYQLDRLRDPQHAAASHSKTRELSSGK